MSDWDAVLDHQRREFETAELSGSDAMIARRAREYREKSPPPLPESDPKLQMWDRDLIKAIVLAVVGGVAVIALGYIAVDQLVDVSDRAITPAQHFTAAFALATSLGVLVALVVNVRKQNLAEQVARREITAAFTERFRSAAQQLGGPSPAERLAGVYAMAALADEYPSRRQQCVDVLCGYLRLPFDPTTDHLVERSTTTTHVFADGRTHTVHQNPASRPFDQQVRQTIMAVIREHVTEGAPMSWSGLDFNFAEAHLINVDLAFSEFHGQVSFNGAIFSGPTTDFTGTTFSASVTFEDAIFLGAVTLFWNTTFTGSTSFNRATFSSPRTWFHEAKFLGGMASTFVDATFSGMIEFNGAELGDRTPGVRGLEDPKLVRDAQITKDGQPFRGWPRRVPG